MVDDKKDDPRSRLCRLCRLSWTKDKGSDARGGSGASISTTKASDSTSKRTRTTSKRESSRVVQQQERMMTDDSIVLD